MKRHKIKSCGDAIRTAFVSSDDSDNSPYDICVTMKEVLSCLSMLMYADTPQFTSHLLTSALPGDSSDRVTGSREERCVLKICRSHEVQGSVVPYKTPQKCFSRLLNLH